MQITFPSPSANTAQDQAEINALLSQLRSAGDVCLNLGCGDHPIEGVTNCDLHNDKADVKTDITRLPQFQDGSVCFLETHHAIEHLSMEQVRPAIAEWHRVLKLGGHLVITCPDLEKVLQLWQASDRTLDCYELKMLFGSQEHEGMFHKCGFCAESLPRLLNDNGFATRFTFTPYPDRSTPSLLVIAEKL